MEDTRIKVLYIVSKLNKGGPINQLLYLCRYIEQSKIDFTILTISPKKAKVTIHEELYKLGIQVIELNLSKLKSILKTRKIIQSIINKKKIHIVHSFGFRADYIAGSLEYVFKISSVRNTVKVNTKYIYGLFLGEVIGRYHITILKKFNQIIACSYSVQVYLKNFGLNALAIQNSVDIYKLQTLHKQSIKGKLGIPCSNLTFITVNSKLPGKNVEFLLEQFSGNAKLNDYNLVITGYSQQSLINKYSMLKNIIFTGRVTNFDEYLKAADYFISASLHEGMPNAPLEALAEGIPVLLSNINSHNEIVTTINDYIGEIFINNDSVDFQSKVDSLLTRRYETVSRNALNGVKEHFNAPKMAERFQNVYLNARKF